MARPCGVLVCPSCCTTFHLTSNDSNDPIIRKSRIKVELAHSPHMSSLNFLSASHVSLHCCAGVLGETFSMPPALLERYLSCHRQCLPGA